MHHDAKKEKINRHFESIFDFSRNIFNWFIGYRNNPPIVKPRRLLGSKQSLFYPTISRRFAKGEKNPNRKGIISHSPAGVHHTGYRTQRGIRSPLPLCLAHFCRRKYFANMAMLQDCPLFKISQAEGSSSWCRAFTTTWWSDMKTPAMINRGRCDITSSLSRREWGFTMNGFPSYFCAINRSRNHIPENLCQTSKH